MAQHDYVVANGSGATVRGDFNDAFLAVATVNSGATAPSTTYAYMPYINTSDGHLYQRNAANTAWIDHGTVASRLLRAEDIAAGGSGGLLRTDGDGSGLSGVSPDAQYPPGFVYNARVTLNASEPTTDVDIPKYSLRNDAGDANIDVASAMTKQVDATFAEGTNAGGMASGESVPTSDFIYLFSVTKNADGTVDNMFDTSPTGANVNAGWTVEKLLARFSTDSSANIDKVVNFWLGGDYIFDSDGYTITYGGPLTISHGLSGIPQDITPRLLCVTADLGYSVGDDPEINKHSLGTGTTASSGVSITKDDTNIYVRYGSADMRLLDKGTGNGNTIASAKWRLVLRAEL